MSEGFNINKFVEGSNECLDLNVDVVQPSPKTSKVKKTIKKSTEIVPVPEAPVPTTSMSYIQQNIPYAMAYDDTNNQLDETITQLNVLGVGVFTDLEMVRGNKTLRNKYNIVNDMTQAATSILSTKLAAIKEKNTVIGAINKLELDRMKQLKTTQSEEDDNTRIANLYDAFINMPIGAGPSPVLGPSIQDIVSGVPSGTGLPMASIGGDQQAWEQSLDPAQNRMVLEAKGMIETVIMFDESTGNRWFEVVDKTTGQPVNNVEKPDNSYIYDLDLDIRNGIAKDSNRKETYRLICTGVNPNSNISDY